MNCPQVYFLVDYRDIFICVYHESSWSVCLSSQPRFQLIARYAENYDTLVKTQYVLDIFIWHSKRILIIGTTWKHKSDRIITGYNVCILCSLQANNEFNHVDDVIIFNHAYVLNTDSKSNEFISISVIKIRVQWWQI